MFTIIFTLFLASIVQNTFLNTEGVRPTLYSSILKQSDISSSQVLVTIELKYRILYNRGWARPDLRSIYRFGGHLNLDAKIQVR